MEKLPMCRICLAENVRMHVVVNRNLHDLYEKLTDIPFLTNDSRPILACFFCCAKLKQCYQLMRKCLEAEELFAQMMKEDYEPNFLINQNHLKFFSGFVKSPIECISIIDECQTESIAIKEELPVVCEAQDDIIEPKEEHQSDELEPENADNSCLDVADILPHQSESDLEDDIIIMELKTEVEVEQEVSEKRRRATETERATVAKKPELETPRTSLEDAIAAEQTKKDKSDSKVIQTTEKLTSKPDSYFTEPYKCNQLSFKRVKEIFERTRSQIGEKPYKCHVCQRSFVEKGQLTIHVCLQSGGKPFKCDLCDRGFVLKSSLKRHFLIHTGVKRSIRYKTNSKTHYRIHTGDKPFKCDICERKFVLKSSLTRHFVTHTGEKPFKCDICERSFVLKSSLTRHFVTHTGEKPFKSM